MVRIAAANNIQQLAKVAMRKLAGQAIVTNMNTYKHPFWVVPCSLSRAHLTAIATCIIALNTE